jgi:hypothetical protein
MGRHPKLWLGLVASVAILAACGGVVWKATAAHASCGGFFLCPHAGDPSNGWDQMTLDTTDDQTGNHGSDTPYNPVVNQQATLVRPGDTITVSISYNVNSGYCGCDKGPAIVWANIGGDGAGFSPDLFQPGSIQDISNPGGTFTSSSTQTDNSGGYPNSGTYLGYPVSGVNPNAPTTTNQDIINNEYNPSYDYCPSYYYDYAAGSSEINDGSGNHYGGSASGEPVGLDGWGFPTDGSGNSIPSDWRATCGDSGKSAVWTGAATGSGIHTYTMQFGISPNATSTQKFCIRGELAFHRFSGEYARTTGYGCFQMQQVAVYGYVSSDPSAATGQGLNGAQLTVYGNCNNNSPSDSQTVTTANDASGAPGYYNFLAIAGAPFCINPQNPFSDSTTNTSYNNPTPAPGFPTENCTSNCGPFNFYYEPIPVAMPPTKSANPASGTSLTPGQGINFSITASNPIDSNTPADYVADEIPLNIDPTSVSLANVSASFSSTGSAPSGWSANAPITCNDVVNDVSFGYGGSSNLTAVQCGYSPPNGTTPGYVYVLMSNMPAYSQVTLNWGGDVTSAPLVGVYPTNGAYCNNGAVNYGDPNSVYADCQDFTAGLQGVSNFAYSSIDSEAPVFSTNDTYNPIPGSLACVGKDTDARTELGEPLSSGTGNCGTNAPGPGDYWVYSTSDPTYNSANFRILVGLNPNQGPVHYTVIDQNDGQATTDTGAPLDPALQNTSGLSGSGQQNGPAGSQWLSWGGQNSADVSNPQYTYHDTFTNDGDGHVADNSVKACWPQYWTVGYPVSCVTTATPLTITQEQITNPFVTTSNGDIHAGGGPGPPNQCSTPATVQGAQNPGATGQYFVTASGDLTGASDKTPFFTSAAGTASLAYGVVCRPDVVTSTTNYANTAGNEVAYTPAMQSIWNNPAAQASLDGKVLVANGDVNIPTGAIIGARFTLLVNNGNVNIGGNITNSPIALNGQPETINPSFGVVVNNGNIYVDRTVSQLDGFYFVAPFPGTTSNGLINTCASADGAQTLQSGYTVNGPSGCDTPLVVQGIMMAYGFRLDRTTPPTTGGGTVPTNPSEYVQFDDRLYTATPPGFSDLSQTYLPPIYLPETNPRY